MQIVPGLLAFFRGNASLRSNSSTVRSSIFLLAISLLVVACHAGQSVTKPSGYPDHVGDIAPDPALDDPSFKACRENYIPQYYSTNSDFKGEKPALEAYFREKFIKNKAHARESGYITIRFVVNCRGQTGRFRVQEIGLDYLPKKFPSALTNRLLELTKQLDGWQPGQRNGLQLDCYQYLTFTINNGDISQIMP